MTLNEHNRMSSEIARVVVFFGALALSQSPSTTQLPQPVDDSRRRQ